MHNVRIAITIGDANGIGPEVLLRALASPRVAEICSPIIVGNARLLADYAAMLRTVASGFTPHIEVDGTRLRCNGVAYPVVEIPTSAELAVGHWTPESGRLAGDAITRAVAMTNAGDADAIVTMPISKAGLNAGGYAYPGHTEMLATLTGGTPLMILATRGMRVALATIHVPLARVAGLLTTELIEHRARQLADALGRDFGIPTPRIAVLGANPHTGEEGTIGTEERDAIIPAILRLRSAGIDANGPFPADGFFARFDPARQDGILAMYHDQGLIPLKMYARGGGVNITAGLPIVRTSPDHGTAYDIAGRAMANADSTIEAIETAVMIARNRAGEPTPG